MYIDFKTTKDSLSEPSKDAVGVSFEMLKRQDYDVIPSTSS